MITLYKNGNIHTMDALCPTAEAAIVDGNKFVFVGSLADARKYMQDNSLSCEERDLGGRLIIPGFNDSHLHLLHFGRSLRSIQLAGAESIGEIRQRISDYVKNRRASDASWILGEGWNHDYFKDEKRFLNKFDLDDITGTIPALIMRTCYHVGVLNTAAMDIIGLNRETAPMYGDLAGLMPDGEPDGVIKESMLSDIKSKISVITLEDIKEMILEVQDIALSQGLTSLQSDDIGYTSDNNYELLFEAFKQLEDSGELKIRVGEQSLLRQKPLIEEFFKKGYNYSYGTDKFRVSCIKILTDGSLGARTAAMRKPYADDGSTSGIALYSQEELDEIAELCHRNGCPMAIHAIGDRAMEMSLNAIEKAKKSHPELNPRHSIVHCQITDRELLERFKALDVLAMVQPIFIDYDMNIVYDRVGEALANTSYAWKTMIDMGVHISFGTDCPVEPLNTMPNIYTAVTRQNIKAEEKRTYLPNERLSMQEAIYAYTAGGAYATGEENIKGTISPGKLADFIVLDRDLFSLNNNEEILNTKVVETYMDGQLVYSNISWRN